LARERVDQNRAAYVVSFERNYGPLDSNLTARLEALLARLPIRLFPAIIDAQQLRRSAGKGIRIDDNGISMGAALPVDLFHRAGLGRRAVRDLGLNIDARA
jgi:hypothetical protein